MWGVRVRGGVGIVHIGTLFTLQLIATVPAPLSGRAKSPRVRVLQDTGPAYTAPSLTEAPAGHSIALPALATLDHIPFFKLLETSSRSSMLVDQISPECASCVLIRHSCVATKGHFTELGQPMQCQGSQAHVTGY